MIIVDWHSYEINLADFSVILQSDSSSTSDSLNAGVELVDMLEVTIKLISLNRKLI